MNLTPKELEISRISALCAISCLGTRGSWSNFACLAEKRAFRLGCASLSAPPALRFKASPTKRKIRHARMNMPYFWRRRKDLNLRAGYPTYTLSRGASSPLEYFSIYCKPWFGYLPNYYIKFFQICQAF